nr:hypothetical protein CFP56_56903 [Quercus suber]
MMARQPKYCVGTALLGRADAKVCLRFRDSRSVGDSRVRRRLCESFPLHLLDFKFGTQPDAGSSVDSPMQGWSYKIGATERALWAVVVHS